MDTACPPVTRTASVAVYEWRTRDLMGAAMNDDSLYLTRHLRARGIPTSSQTSGRELLSYYFYLPGSRDR